MLLENRVALITGAGRGIGRAIALACAREGAKLSLTARTSKELKETARLARQEGAETCAIAADITYRGEVDSVAQQTLDHFGAIDVLVNNAGVIGPIGPLQENDIDDWIRTIQVNLVGTFLCCRAVIPVMLAQGRGKIINLAGAGSASAPYHLSAYGSSKAAVVRLTEVLALELSSANVQVNALGPGSIHTRMWEEIRDGAQEAGDEELYQFGVRVTSGGGASMDRAADLAVWLASDASGKLSGRLIHAVMDDFRSLSERIPEIMASDAFTLRRAGLQD